MSAPFFDRLMLAAVVGILVSSPASSPASPRVTPDSVTIVVFTERYTVGDRAFDDLDLLEKDITGAHLRGVNILVCGPRATRALKAVVHRFRHVPVQIRVPDADEPDCFSKAAAVMPASQRSGRRPFGIDDAAVERYWSDLMP